MAAVQSLGKYEIRRQLGRGAMGTVYEGWDPIIKRVVAIKTVRLPNANDAETVEEIARFRREAEAAGRLTHTNIVGVYDYGETEDLAFIVMEFVDGPPLKDLLDKGERFPLPRIARIMGDLLAGLQFSHERGVVHRDIKPANLMLTQSGQAKIADFGIARIESSSMTQAGTVLGTPAYMSPEQFMGEVVDARSDIYSSGVLLYQLLTGERPFEGSMSSIMHKALNTDVPVPSRISVTAPRQFDAVVGRAMAKRPDDRFDTAAEFATAIRHAMAKPREAAAVPPAQTSDATIVAPRRAAPAATAAVAAVVAPAGPPAGIGAANERRSSSSLPLIAGASAATLALLGGVGYFLLSGTTTKSPPAPVSAPEQAAAIPPATPAVQTPAPPAPVASAPVASAPAVAVPQPAMPPAPQAQPVTPPSPAVAPPIVTAPPVRIAPPVSAPAEPVVASPVLPPPPLPLPQAPARTPLEQARATARSVPCAVLNIAGEPDGPRISGLAASGPELDGLLDDLRGIGRVSNDITWVDRFACAPIAAMADFVRNAWADTPPALAVRPDQREVASGARLGIDIAAALPAVTVDVFTNDGLVRHLARPVASGSAGSSHVTWVATPGPALVVAAGSAEPPDLGRRPERENAAEYLAVLESSLRRAAVPPTADLAMVTVRPAPPARSAEPRDAKPRIAEPAVAKAPQPRAATLPPARCSNIISRAQLGETLSNAELTALRTECR